MSFVNCIPYDACKSVQILNGPRFEKFWLWCAGAPNCNVKLALREQYFEGRYSWFIKQPIIGLRKMVNNSNSYLAEVVFYPFRALAVKLLACSLLLNLSFQDYTKALKCEHDIWAAKRFVYFCDKLGASNQPTATK